MQYIKVNDSVQHWCYSIICKYNKSLESFLGLEMELQYRFTLNLKDKNFLFSHNYTDLADLHVYLLLISQRLFVLVNNINVSYYNNIFGFYIFCILFIFLYFTFFYYFTDST